jgi:FkbM family methyltransferase
VNLDYRIGGLKIRIENRSDWIIYNEIFVKGVYDAAIRTLSVATGGRPLQVLDLGANVGFFALRIAYLATKEEFPSDIRMTLVEGSPMVFTQLTSRIEEEPALKDRVVLVHGLVGARKGSAKIFESATFGAGNSLFSQQIPDGVEVAYIDLANHYAHDSKIDLLKCDIEGSEQNFLENYGELLPAIKAAVFEFHPEMCDVAKCQQILRDAGFCHEQVLTDDMTLYWR